MSRRLVLTATALGLSAMAATALLDLPVGWVWNATRSAPVGLWRRDAVRGVAAGDWVLVQPPPRQAEWLAGRGYLPRGALLIKVVAAAGGQTVCRRGGNITIDDRLIARALARDTQGRRLPVWRGCHRLDARQLFLLNAHPASLDGRYLGVTSTDDVRGRATLVWRHRRR